MFTWHTSAIKTLADLEQKETLIAGTGPLSQAEINSLMLNGVVGTKFRLIRGYKGSAEAALAVERGEADGTLMPWEYLKAAHADWIDTGKISIVARYVRHPIKERPDVPSVYDLAQTNEQRDVLNLFLGSDEMGHPIAMPPDVPRERVAAVRTAFARMIEDPEFLAGDAARQEARGLLLQPLQRRGFEGRPSPEAFMTATPAEIDIATQVFTSISAKSAVINVIFLSILRTGSRGRHADPLPEMFG